MFFKIFSAFLLIGFVSAIDDPIAEILKYVSVDDIKEGETYSFDFDSHILYDIGPENCTKAGPICGTCVDVYECIEIGQGFIVIPLKTCNEDETCQFSTGTCITSHNPECPETTTYAFECYQTGLFPDAVNCQKYHMCTVANVNARDSIEMTCSGNYYYDPKTTLCKKRLVNGDCPDPIPDCVEIGNHGIVQGNPWMYYICLRAVGSNKIFPQIFLCPQDSEYNLSTNSCVPSDLNTGIGSDSKCTSAGTFYIPSNCNMFLECSAAGADPVARTCETRTYFNPSTKQCTEYTCADLG